MEILQFDPNQAVAKGAAIFGFKFYLDEEIKIKVAEATGKSAEEVDLAIGGAVVEEAQKQVALEQGLALPAVKKLSETKVSNVTSKSFGIVVVDPSRGADKNEVVANLITKDTRVPVSVSKQFGTHAPNQTSADLRCMENQSDNGQIVELGECKELGNAELGFGKALPAGSPVEITFHLKADGLLVMKGKDLTTSEEIEARFKTESIMELEELEEARSRNLSLAVS